MRTRDEILAEIHKLMAEQAALFESRLDSDKSAQYFQKKKRIDKLLAEIAREEQGHE